MDKFNQLIDQLNSDSVDTRIAALQGLGDLGDTRAVEPIIDLLNDEAEVVYNAVFWLGQLKDERAVNPLLELLKKEDKTLHQQIRGQVGVVLSFFDSATEPLIELLTHQDYGIRLNAVRGLARYRNKQAVCPLIDLLNIEANLPSPENSIFAIFEIIKSLEEIYDDRAIEPLNNLLKHEDINIPPAAAKALMEFADKSSIGPLTELLSNQDLIYQRQAIVEALESIKYDNEFM
ncbi:MAG: hypothetical protein CL961_00470 [Euryarchaeota archaeon]|nr:hypothetical protein [Euryarchaeota archaeon]